MPIFRFYFDGLIAHVHNHHSDDGYTATLGNLIVGASEQLILTTQTYEGSWQRNNLITVMSESRALKKESGQPSGSAVNPAPPQHRQAQP